jgi:hypothetical protein
MPVVTPPKPRHKLQELDDKLIFTIRNPRHPSTVFMPLIWALIFTCLLGALIVSRIWPGSVNFEATGISDPVVELLCLIPYFGFWLGLPWFAFLWQLTGKETIEVDATSIKLRKSIVGVGKTREYFVNDVHDFQVMLCRPDKLPFRWFSRDILNLFYSFTGKATFNYQGREIRFAGFVDWAEATQIIEIFQKRFPQYETIPEESVPVIGTLSPPLVDTSDAAVVRVTIPGRKAWRSGLLTGYSFFGLSIVFAVALYILILFIVPDVIQSISEQQFPFEYWLGIVFGSVMAFMFLMNWLVWSYQFLWPFIGRETIEIRSDGMTLLYQLSFYKQANYFDGAELRRFRVTAVKGDISLPAPSSTRNNGFIVFDYGAKTFYCGNDATEAESHRIVAIIHQRFLQYR